ncbi:AraC family transcriptional regulator [Mollicutes bacterium LVI A0078]|nr:AraC family transcriptional regulator [Mollicutes bacterium LVI A0075]WOO90737.1 AraC family transcriptional regulator [Mollicutes bacterium LVI A0078]
MNNLKRLNEAMNYIESNLDNEIDMKEVGRIALCSEFHFSKMFSYLAGMHLSEYVRKRRLSLAAIDLMRTNAKVIDIAIKYNYNSADAFSRAFYKVHQILPSEVKGSEEVLKAFPKMNFEINISGGNEMEYCIITKDEFNLIGFKKRVTITHNGVNEEIASMQKLLTAQSIKEIKAMSNTEPTGMLSASMNFVDRHIDGVGQMDHIIGVASTDASDTYSTTKIDAATWAVFTVDGIFPKALQETWANIYGQWFPSSSYIPTGGAELTWHAKPTIPGEHYEGEIWVPVKLNEDN